MRLQKYTSSSLGLLTTLGALVLGVGIGIASVAKPSHYRPLTSHNPAREKNMHMHISQQMRRAIVVPLMTIGLLAGILSVGSITSGSAQASTVKPVHVTRSAYATQCANYWDSNTGWSGGFLWNDTVYAGYCWNGYQVWHRYGPDCSTTVNLQGIGGSAYGNDTTACFTSGDWSGQLLVGYNWNWYTYLSPWDKHSGNYLRFVVNANGQIIGRWGQAGV